MTSQKTIHKKVYFFKRFYLVKRRKKQRAYINRITCLSFSDENIVVNPFLRLFNTLNFFDFTFNDRLAIDYLEAIL